MENSITKLRKWNLIAGGIDPRNDVIPASVGYGLEEGLQFAVSEITRLQDRIKRLEEAGDDLYANCDPSRWDSTATAARKLSEQNAWLKGKEAKL